MNYTHIAKIKILIPNTLTMLQSDELKQLTIDENVIVLVSLHKLDKPMSQLSKCNACGNDDIDN